MRTIAEILTEPCSEEEYLDKKRIIFKQKHDAFVSEISALSNDKQFVDATLSLSEQYMNNLFILPGTEGKPFFVGDPPRWNERPVSDEEYVFSLNRLHEIIPLSHAYILTNDKKYAEKAISDILDWIHSCPRPTMPEDKKELVRVFNGVSAWRILECGIRLFESFNAVYQYLLFSEPMTPSAHAEYVSSVYEQAEILSLVSPVAWPKADHNHYIHEMLGLLVTALHFPEFKTSKAWLEQSTRELFRAIRAQITEEGAQCEGCANYHDICLDMIAKALKEMSDNGIPLPSDIKTLTERAYGYSAWTLSPTGRLASVGDSFMLPKTLPALIDGYYKREGTLGPYGAVVPLIDRTLCSAVPNAVFDAESEKADKSTADIRHYRSVGQIIARTGWNPDDSYFHFICKTPVVNGHAHIDPMSFTLVMRGQDVVTDPSYYTYQDGEARRRYKSIKYHSSLTFNDREPFEYVSTWKYTPQKNGNTLSVYKEKDLLAGDAYHENYAPAEHRRLTALLGKDIFVICDDVYNPCLEKITLRFHLDTRDYSLTPFGASDGRVNIFLPSGRCAMENATKSPFTDLSEPTEILSVEPVISGEKAVYVTVFSLYDGIKASAVRIGGEIRISITDGKQYSRELVWRPGEYCSLN